MMRKIFAITMGFVTFAAILTLVLAINDWGRSAPPEIAQLFWGFNLAIWPFLVGTVLWPRKSFYD